MIKPLFDVFTELDLSADERALFEDAQITKIGANRDRNRIRIYLHANHLIPKESAVHGRRQGALLHLRHMDTHG